MLTSNEQRVDLKSQSLSFYNYCNLDKSKIKVDSLRKSTTWLSLTQTNTPSRKLRSALEQLASSFMVFSAVLLRHLRLKRHSSPQVGHPTHPFRVGLGYSFGTFILGNPTGLVPNRLAQELLQSLVKRTPYSPRSSKFFDIFLTFTSWATRRGSYLTVLS